MNLLWRRQIGKKGKDVKYVNLLWRRQIGKKGKDCKYGRLWALFSLPALRSSME